MEAAGSFTQVAHDDGNAINYNATQPFRPTGAGASAPKNSKANDQCYKRGGYGPWAESAERSTTAVNSELAGDLLCCVKRQTEIF